jgi:carbon-monoxide dehydrogenase medium subunit
LRAIKEMIAIDAKPGSDLTIGAMTPLSALEYSPIVRNHAPVITRTLKTLSNIRVRNVATVGGNLAHGDPHMDLPPVLMALGARVAVTSRTGKREIPVDDLFVGYFETSLKRDELISSLIVPGQGACSAAYLKCTTRAVHDWPALGVAASIDRDGDKVRDARIVISAATETPRRLPGAEAALRSGGTSEASLRQVGEAAAQEAELITDGQGSAAYKKQLVRVYVARALRAALAPDGGSHDSMSHDGVSRSSGSH